MSLAKMIRWVVVFRLAFLVLMAFSCAVVPEHNPGDGVQRFDMRLEGSGSQSCFCLPGHACDNRQSAEFLEDECANEIDAPRLLPNWLWTLVLTPTTKWDAARFLNLAVNPRLRDPPAECQTSNSLCDFTSSEQAHAFFPLFPLLIRRIALFLQYTFPEPLLPPTFEALAAFSGILLNIICLILGSVSLFYWVLGILPSSAVRADREYVALSASLVYGMWNPAYIFFATNYSESLFGALSLAGHACFVSKRLWPAAVLFWMLASAARSNGSIHALWLLQQLLGQILISSRQSKSLPSWTDLLYGMWLVLGALCIFFPIRYHDWKGMMRHCHDRDIRPDWCPSDTSFWSGFSLYAWTQRRHWNVGFLHYYEMKQIPNLLLGAPILILGGSGVCYWIKTSILSYGKGKIPQRLRAILIEWPIHALSASVSNPNYGSPQDRLECVAHLVNNPLLLGHYAILALLTLVGCFIAHVQISTRLIISSSPAIICILTYCHLQSENQKHRVLVNNYTLLYMLLGVILHVNFLPWT